MRAGRIVAASFGGLAALLAFGLAAGGIALVVIHATQRDQTGYYQSGTERLSTPSYAITTTRLNLGATTAPADWADTEFGTVRLRVRAVDGGPVFLGIARSADVDRYLAGSAHDELTDISGDPFRVTYRQHRGEQPPTAPAGQDFWVVSASGAGEQTLYWDVASGRWSVVLMNADARPGLTVDASAGVRTGVLLPVGLGLLGFGLLVGCAGRGAAGRGHPPARPAAVPAVSRAAPGAGGRGGRPARCG